MEAGIARYGRTVLAALTAALMVFSMMAVWVEPANANHEGPDDTVPQDAPAGTNEASYWEGYLEDVRGIAGASCTKINEASSTAFVMPAEPDGEDWVLLIVKQATTNYVYYDPIAGHTYPSAGDQAPGYSHLIVCSVDEPAPGEIIVEKEVTEGSDPELAFTFNTTGFTLDDNTLADGESGSSGDLAVGNYAVSESVPTGWSLQSATCDDGSDPSSIDLSAGETVTCTFVNDEDEVPPGPGEIIVAKEVTEGADSVTFTFNTTGFTLGDNTLAHGESSSSGDVAPGDGYSVSEVVPAGWTLVDATCDDGSDPSNIDVSAGETVICTFENTEDDEPSPVNIVLDLDCDIAWTGSEFTMHGVVDFELTPDNGVESITITPKPGGSPAIDGATWSGNPVSLVPWDYAWEANMLDGFVGEPPAGEILMHRDNFFAGCSCPSGTIDLSDTGVLQANDTVDDSRIGEPASPVDIAAGSYHIYLASFDDHSHKPGQNQPQEIWALADAEDGSGSFESPPTGDLPDNVNFMSYHVTAGGAVSVPAFDNAALWTVHAAAPSSNINSIQPVCAQLVRETLPGEIIVEKVVSSGDTSQEFDFDASYDVDGFSLADGESNSSGELNAGVYSVSEDVPDGWTLVSATCDDGSDPSSIDLSAGETVTCTFVNDEDEVPPEPGQIIVQKVVTGGASQTFEFTFNTGGFTLDDNTLAHGQSSSSGDVAAGDGYSVSEDVPAAWTLVSATCDDGSPPSNIDVEAGETVTCTFTNTIDDVVGASILVTVAGTCVEDGTEGEGLISVTVSVDGGATVVIRDSDDDVVGTFTADGSVTVPEGATYTWEATPNEGFEFPAGADTSGSITIETCSDPETLPFTGLNLDTMAIAASVLLGAGLLMLLAMRREEEA